MDYSRCTQNLKDLLQVSRRVRYRRFEAEKASNLPASPVRGSRDHQVQAYDLLVAAIEMGLDTGTQLQLHGLYIPGAVTGVGDLRTCSSEEYEAMASTGITLGDTVKAFVKAACSSTRWADADLVVSLAAQRVDAESATVGTSLLRTQGYSLIQILAPVTAFISRARVMDFTPPVPTLKTDDRLRDDFHTLDSLERYVVTMTAGLYGDPISDASAAEVLGLTTEAVRRIRDEAMEAIAQNRIHQLRQLIRVTA